VPHSATETGALDISDIQGDSGEEMNTLGGDNMGHCGDSMGHCEKRIHMHMYLFLNGYRGRAV
jgi:hypothetical protein